MLPCVLFEDEHLLAVNKPAGMNTHAPGPFAGEGIYEWLKHREPRWADLAIIHRLDKETSGVVVFGKTPTANRSLTGQFAGREVRKQYLLLTARPPRQGELVIKSKISRRGDRYASGATGEAAETRFRFAGRKSPFPGAKFLEAEPLTGRTHQIRVHAAENGFAILGDTLYGGAKFPRVCLHAAEINFRHPVTGAEMKLKAPIDFSADIRAALRLSLIDPEETNAFRLIHGASDGWPGWYVDQLGGYLLSQSEQELAAAQRGHLEKMSGGRGIYHKKLNRLVRRATAQETSPRLFSGETAPPRFEIRENGVRFELGFGEGYSVGLFLDQRDNRRRLLTGHIAADFPLFGDKTRGANLEREILNCFAYTCGFSVCAARAGARATSLDLSKKYLEWGRRNFALNGIDSGKHDFIFGDVFDWLRRFEKKQRHFDVIILDPPTFSQSREHGVFRVEKDFGKLAAAALDVLKPEGVLLASSNSATWEPEDFLSQISGAAKTSRRQILRRQYFPQPPDFPICREEPAHLKSVWLKIS